jgi:hypothetical protein
MEIDGDEKRSKYPAICKSRYTKAIGDEMIANVQLGADYVTAARAVGVGVQEFRVWVDRADNHAETYPELAEWLEGMRKASGGVRMKHLKRIDVASDSPQFWQASKWMLEKLMRERFGTNSEDAALLKELIKEFKAAKESVPPVAPSPNLLEQKDTDERTGTLPGGDSAEAEV